MRATTPRSAAAGANPALGEPRRAAGRTGRTAGPCAWRPLGRGALRMWGRWTCWCAVRGLRCAGMGGCYSLNMDLRFISA